ncbi:MAG TPA: glycosyltransferase family 2 protein [bacterium]|nr:glycosyltransferase family 2 protein [bacterium]
MKVLSVIIAAYNEKATIKQAVSAVKKTPLRGLKKEIIIVDDGSTDGTCLIIKELAKKDKTIKTALKEKNTGKGSAIREGLKLATGNYIVFQDADLEYDPDDYPALLKPLLKGRADVVYGSRFKGGTRAFLLLNYIANKILNAVTNILYNSTLTDMETCYKLFRSDVIKSLELRSNGFEIEPEITAKILKKKYRIYEVPITFYGRGYDEGKKIKARDGFIALWTLLKHRFID